MKTLESASDGRRRRWLARKRLDNQGLSRIRFRSAPEVVQLVRRGAIPGLRRREMGRRAAPRGGHRRRHGARLRRRRDPAHARRCVRRGTSCSPDDIRWLLALTGAARPPFNGVTYRKYEMDARAITTQPRRDRAGPRRRRSPHARGARRRDPAAQDPVRRRAARASWSCTRSSSAADLQRPTAREAVHLRAHRGARAARTALTREEALVELTRRYFTSHGPATARDFAWWSGLSTDGRRVPASRRSATASSARRLAR